MKPSKFLSSLAIATTLICSPCAASDYIFSDFGAYIVDPTSGTGLLPSGSLILFGYVNPLTFNFGSTQNDFASINSAFVRMGSAFSTSANLNIGNPIFTQTVSGFTAPVGFDGTQMYIWVFNQATANASASWAILTNPTWLLNNSAFQPVTVDLSDAGTVVAGNLVTGFARGSIINPGTHVPASPGGFDVAVTVPEPSTYFLGLVGGTALLGALRLHRARSVT